MSIHLVIPDSHAHPDHDNSRASLLSKLIADIKPDVVVNLGDTWDMPSLSSYDKGKKNFHGRNYQKDIEAGIEFNDRLFADLRRQKRKLPYRVFLEGNHEERLKRAIQLQPELEGEGYGIHFNDFQLDKYYNDVIEYDGGKMTDFDIDEVNSRGYKYRIERV